MKNSTKQTLKSYFRLLFSRKWLTITISLMAILGSLIGVIIPIYTKKFVDTAAGSLVNISDVANSLLIILGTILIFELTRWLVWRISAFLYNYLQPKMISELSIFCFSELHKHSFAYFNNNFVGSLVKRVNWFTRAFESIMDRVMWDFLPMITVMTSMIVVLFGRNIYLGIGALSWLIIFLTINWILTNYKLKYDIERSEAESAANAILADTITNNQNVKLFVGYNREVNRFSEAAEKVRKLRLFTWNLDAVFDGVQGLLSIGLEIGIMYLGIILWRESRITLGDFILIQAYVGMIIERTWGFGKIVRNVFSNLADAEEMTILLNTPIEIMNKQGASELNVQRGQIIFNDVSFNYSEDRQIINGLNLSIGSKEKIALVGSSGSGKSTIVKILLRMYEIGSGKILIDNQSIDNVTQESLWKNISMVPQDPILFHRSLLENIRYGKPDASDEEVIAAAKLAHCHEFIQNFPDQYETFVGERGVKLSGGERQRVAIARAILRNAPILILDEATSSLDSESEKLIQDALSNLMANKTVIVVAHRLSTIMKMDRIIVMNNGGIIESGKHEELLNIQNGYYKNLWKIQAGGFLPENETEKNII